MDPAVPVPSSRVLPVAGAVIAVSGLAAAAALLDAAGRSVLLPLSEAGLALGVAVLVLGHPRIVGTSPAARGAVLLFGVGPFVYRLEPGPTPWSVVIGMLTIGLITVATITSAVLVARTRQVHGVARWALVLPAADALLTAVMSSTPIEGLVFAYLAGHLELVRPVTLLVWGTALALPWTRLRRDSTAIIATWKRTTDVGGASEVAATTPATASKRRRSATTEA